MDEAAIVARIRREHSVGTQVYFEDPEFPANDKSLYHDVTVLPDYAKVEPRKSTGPHPWLYPHQFCPAPKLFVGGSSASDVIQGQLGDCWLLGAMAAVANHPAKLMDKLFLTPEDDFVECGIMTIQLYKDGEWHPVTIDTRVPFGDQSSQIFNNPVYAHCAETSEQWVMMLEKAFAKLHGCYQSLNGGSVAEALVDLTGGVSQKVTLSDPAVKELALSGKLWSDLKRLVQQGALVGCSMSVRDGGFEEDAGTGILVNHAYSVLHCKEVGRSLKFLKVRNPWGHGEWRGDWSDGWSGWSEHPDVETALADDPSCGFKRGDDGVFWMIWEDYIRHFNKIYICRVFSDEYNQYAVKGCWKGSSAAGAHKMMADIDADETKMTEKSARHLTARDGDAFWFHNPQIRVTCASEAKVLISLMQSDRKLKGVDQNHSIRFTVTALKKTHKGRLWHEDLSEIVADSDAATFSQRFPQREVTFDDLVLDPKLCYIIVPHTIQPKVENNFLLRLFSESELSVATVPDPFCLQIRSGWTADSSGGPLRIDGKDNPTWGLNPQFWLTTTAGGDPSSVVVVKVVLQRTDRGAARDDKAEGPKNKIGLVVTRTPPPPPPSNPRRKKAGQRRTNALGVPLPIKESSLRRPGATSTAAAGGAEDAASEVGPPQRRLEVRVEEFCQTSEFCDLIVATTLLKVPADWLASGLLIHPCMRLPGREGEFQLSVYSDIEVQLQELTSSAYKLVPGSWVKGKTANGCHLHNDWKRNPAFLLSAPEGATESVRITLTRSEDIWRTPCKVDSVGNMIGFYVVTCDVGKDAKFNDGKAGLIAETDFVPLHQVSATVSIPFDSLSGSSKSVLILPCTFDPEKEGPFNLSVTMDCDFDLTPAS